MAQISSDFFDKFFEKIHEIARKHGFGDYKPILVKIIGNDYNTISLYQWGGRARKSGYLMNDMAPMIDSIDLLFAQERLVVDRGTENFINL